MTRRMGAIQRRFPWVVENRGVHGRVADEFPSGPCRGSCRCEVDVDGGARCATVLRAMLVVPLTPMASGGGCMTCSKTLVARAIALCPRRSGKFERLRRLHVEGALPRRVAGRHDEPAISPSRQERGAEYSACNQEGSRLSPDHARAGSSRFRRASSRQ